jgi:DNA (cytosine-5)-methyltransferase 1
VRTHLDLFSGIGGFAIAAQACGYTTIGFCEKEPYAQKILKERFGAVLADAVESRCEANRISAKRNGTSNEAIVCSPRLHSDIFTLNGADYAGVDLLTGGFPCQPFSVAGKRRGAEDDRAIWPEMLRVIREAKPTWIIGENVAGIVTMELDNILSDLEGIGYAAWPLVIPACAVDARHRRDRVWIVAHAASERYIGPKEIRELEGRRSPVNSECTWPGEQSWFAESGMGRVAHGIPNRAHRLRGLGNAIVPQVAFEIIRAIVNLK